jgi:hypothetical protein
VNESPDFDLFVTIRTPETTVKRVRCQLWLPTRPDEEPRLKFFPTQAQARHFTRGRLNPYSIRGRLIRSERGAALIVADEVWTETIPQRSLDRRRHETIFDGEAWDLRVLETWKLDTKTPRSGSIRATTHYLVTPSRELTPIISTWKRRKVLRRVAIKSRPRRRVSFVTLERRERREDYECIFRELAAKETHTIRRRSVGAVDHEQLDALDDLLAIVSFGSRHRVACLAVDSSGRDGHRFRFYRRHMQRPEKIKQSRDDEVVDLADFEEFLAVAHEAYLATGPADLVRHALHVCVPDRERTVESSFASLFSAVESLVLWFRRQHDLEFAVDASEWARSKPDLIALLKAHPVFTTNTERKRRVELVRGNLNALQRVPFSAAFGRFC